MGYLEGLAQLPLLLTLSKAGRASSRDSESVGGDAGKEVAGSMI